jgi:hypothetical protein
MKRQIAFLISLSILLVLVLTACTPASEIIQPTNTTASTPTLTPTVVNTPVLPVSPIRVVVDGKVNSFNAALYENDWYLSPADIKTALGIEAEASLAGYANLRDVAKDADISYEHDAILDAAYIWTDQAYDANYSYDFVRAVELDIVPEDLTSDVDRQITAAEFRDLLSALVNSLRPDKTAWFEENVSTYDKPLLRGEGFVMAYFAAECVGANVINNGWFDHTKATEEDNDFWNADVYELEKLFPNVWDGPVKFISGEEWDDYRVAAFLWSFYYISPYSGYQVFEYDEGERSMRQDQQLTIREAAMSAVRIYDGYLQTDHYQPSVEYVSLNDQKAIDMDRSIITEDLLSKANDLPDINQDNIPVLRGFVISDISMFETYDIFASDQDLRNFANWGFNSVCLVISYQAFFDKNAEQVDLIMLEKLDAFLASAIKYNLHVNFLLATLPGRWYSFDFNTFTEYGEFDLFTNHSRQEEANAIWAVLSERYKDIPSSVLSFSPLWEINNQSLSSGLPVPSYTYEDIAQVYVQLLNTILEHDPDRFVIFEPASNTYAIPEEIIKESELIKSVFDNSYPNSLMMANFVEEPFVYANIPWVDDINIDFQKHSMFREAYPVTIYAAQKHLDADTPLELDGSLVAGTKIDMYLSRVEGSGTLTIMADGNSLYSEDLSTTNYQADVPLSHFYPYAKSEKLISLTLSSDVDNLQISYSGRWFEWSGIDITLPAEYAVERWWFPSAYDSFLYDTEITQPTLLETSNIMLSPNSYDTGRHITLYEDITYTSPAIFAQSDQHTIEEWAKAFYDFSPNLIVRYENAAFSGAIHDSALKYYDDMLSTFDKYGMGWYSNDLNQMLNAHHGSYAPLEPVYYKGRYTDIEMLKILQKYQ